MGDFTGSGDLKSFSDSFMRLSHDENLGKGRFIEVYPPSIKRNETLSVVNEQAEVTFVGKPTGKK